jgi:hypothetical protein
VADQAGDFLSKLAGDDTPKQDGQIYALDTHHAQRDGKVPLADVFAKMNFDSILAIHHQAQAAIDADAKKADLNEGWAIYHAMNAEVKTLNTLPESDAKTVAVREFTQAAVLAQKSGALSNRDVIAHLTLGESPETLAVIQNEVAALLANEPDNKAAKDFGDALAASNVYFQLRVEPEKAAALLGIKEKTPEIMKQLTLAQAAVDLTTQVPKHPAMAFAALEHEREDRVAQKDLPDTVKTAQDASYKIQKMRLVAELYPGLLIGNQAITDALVDGSEGLSKKLLRESLAALKPSSNAPTLLDSLLGISEENKEKEGAALDKINAGYKALEEAMAKNPEINNAIQRAIIADKTALFLEQRGQQPNTETPAAAQDTVIPQSGLAQGKPPGVKPFSRGAA